MDVMLGDELHPLLLSNSWLPALFAAAVAVVDVDVDIVVAAAAADKVLLYESRLSSDGPPVAPRAAAPAAYAASTAADVSPDHAHLECDFGADLDST